MYEFLGHVSTEGGPLLLLDADAAVLWTGASDDGLDYALAGAALGPGADRAGGPIAREGVDAVVWSMPTGTASVWRAGVDRLIVLRRWLTEPELHEESAPLLASAKSAVALGRLRVASGYAVVMWAAEDGRALAPMPFGDRASFGFSVGHSGLVVSLAAGRYVAVHDSPIDGDGFALRCVLSRDGST
jgi:hypothetical protein